jgi:hypothetical protein
MARRPAFQVASDPARPQPKSVVYADWRGEDWLPGGGRRCRHLPSDCVFDVTWQHGMKPHAELREGSCEPELRRVAEAFFSVFRQRRSAATRPYPLAIARRSAGKAHSGKRPVLRRRKLFLF